MKTKNIMKVIVATAIIVLCMIGFTNMGNAQTQADLNQRASAELKATEARMNPELERLYRLAAGDPGKVAKLRMAQAAWLGYRDAHIRAFWPSDDPRDYGSVFPMCVANKLTEMTRARLAELRAMTTIRQGNLCSSGWPQ